MYFNAIRENKTLAKSSKSTVPFGLKVSEYDQEIPQSHTADRPTAPWGRATDHL